MIPSIKADAEDGINVKNTSESILNITNFINPKFILSPLICLTSVFASFRKPINDKTYNGSVKVTDDNNIRLNVAPIYK